MFQCFSLLCRCRLQDSLFTARTQWLLSSRFVSNIRFILWYLSIIYCYLLYYICFNLIFAAWIKDGTGFSARNFRRGGGGAGHFPSLSRRCPSLGNHFPILSRHFPSLGNHFPILRRHFPSLGNQFPMLSRHFTSLGNQFPILRRHSPILRNGWPILKNAGPTLGNPGRSPKMSTKENGRDTDALFMDSKTMRFPSRGKCWSQLASGCHGI